MPSATNPQEDEMRYPNNPDAPPVMSELWFLPADAEKTRQSGFDLPGGPINDAWTIAKWFATPDGAQFYAERSYNGEEFYWRVRSE